MTHTQRFTFPRRAEAVPAARRVLHAFARRLDPQSLHDASLCLSELVTNAVLHPEDALDDSLGVEFTLDGARLHVAVLDPGSGFSQDRPAPGRDGGWGLFIVARLSERWGVARDRGTRVWFEMAV